MIETLAVLFLFLILGMAFWLLIFLVLFISGWISLNLLEKVNPKLAHILVGYPDKEKDEEEQGEE